MQWRVQYVARSQVRTAAAVGAAFADGVGKFAAQASEFVGAASENNSAWLRELTAAKTPRELARAHAEHSKVNSRMFIDRTAELGLIFVDMLEAVVKAMPLQISDVETKPPAATSAFTPARFLNIAAEDQATAPQSLRARQNRNR